MLVNLIVRTHSTLDVAIVRVLIPCLFWMSCLTEVLYWSTRLHTLSRVSVIVIFDHNHNDNDVNDNVDGDDKTAYLLRVLCQGHLMLR